MAINLIILSQQSLLTPKGKSLLNGKLNQLDILEEIQEYQNRYPDLDLSALASYSQSELNELYENENNTENLTREQRKQNRIQRREDRKKSREQRLNERIEEFGVEDPEKERTRIGAEIAILKAKLKSNIPTNTSFTITGRLTETVGGDPIKGAEIMLGYNPNPFGSLPTKDVGFEGVDSPLLPADLDLLGNISADNFKNLDIQTQQQLTNNLNEFRLSFLRERKAARQTERFENRIENNSTNGKDSSTGVLLTVGKLTSLLEDYERYNELEGITVEINPNNLLYIPNRDFNNPNFDKDKEESPTNLKEITGNIDDPTASVSTDEDGQFTIKIIVPIIPSTQKCPIDIAILSKGGTQKDQDGVYVDKSFMQGTFFLLNGDRTIKTNLGIKNVLSFDDAAKIYSQAIKDEIDEAQQKIINIAFGPAEWVLSQRKTAINNISNTIKSKLIPLVVGLLLLFGITKLSEKNRKRCPTPDVLDEIIRRRNNTTRQLNQIYSTIKINTAIAGAFIALAIYLRANRAGLDKLLLPQATGTPPSKDFGGLIFAQGYATTAILQKLNELLERLAADNEDLNKAILTSLVFVIAGAITVTILLNAIDSLIQECAEENGVTQIELTAINQELLDISEEQSDDGNPVVDNTNGFIFSIETDNKNPVGTLKRRFAVAKDSRGVTLLKGNPSFSSSDQILIDELVFYIQQNDLKAS